MTPSKELLSLINLKPKPSEAEIKELMKKIDFKIDAEYLAFIQSADGGEGNIGENYLILYTTEELTSMNPYYEDEDYAEKIFVIGSDGGDTAYAIKKDNSQFVSVPFLDMKESESKDFGKTFSDFLNNLNA
jgi:hypothetical protein